MSELIINGGTTKLRVYLVEENGAVIASFSSEGGVRYTAMDGNNKRLKTLLREGIQDVLRQSGMNFSDIGRCIAYGMITSGLGLLELPHLTAPASVSDLHKGMKSALFEDISPLPIEFIPGVRNFYGTVDADNISEMDMMRGEETEAVGLFSLLQPHQELLLILPGSHNKFIHLGKDGRILGCMTSISGELLDAITHNTILSESVRSSFCSTETYDSAMAIRGAEECRKSGLGRAAFAGRILNTLGHTEPAAVQSFLLGAVLAEDCKALQNYLEDCTKEPIICIAGNEPVQTALTDILKLAGYQNVSAVASGISAQMGIAGALRIAQIA